jgi:hypothetical protein
LIDLEEVHFNAGFRGTCLSFVLLLGTFLSSEGGAFVDELDEEHHPHAMEHESIVKTLLEV